MQKTLIKLLFLQVFLLGVFAACCGLFAGKAQMLAAAAGGTMALSATLLAWMIFRRLPKVMPARVFMAAMVAVETGKWLLVILLGIFFVRQHTPLWLVLGFMATYSAYFWIWLIDRGS